MNTKKNKALQDPDVTELKNQKNIIKNEKNVSAAKRGRKAGSKAKDPEAVNLDNAPSTSALPADTVSASALPVRKRGRPRGSGRKGSRPDSSIQNSLPEAVKSNILRHNMRLYNLDRVKDRNNPVEISERLQTYFSLCASDNIMPTIAGMAFSLGINRVTLWDWINGKRETIKSPDVVNILKNAYSFIESQYEDMLTNGKIIPVSAFFLMKNNFGYQDTSNLVVSANNEHTENIEDIASKAGLLND